MKVAQLCPILCNPGQNSPGQNAGVGSLSLLQGIIPTQGSNLCLLHWQVDSLSLSHQGTLSYLLNLSKFTLRENISKFA